jgi:2-methylcitrate dehydratase PrpD
MDASKSATDPNGPTGRLANWVAGLDIADVPAAVLERASYLPLDGIGCAMIGAGLPWSRVATEAVLQLEGDGGAVIIGTGKTTSAPAAAVLNGTFIQGFELDDFHPLAPLHSCSLLIPALLSTASVGPTPTNGVGFLLAAIAGFEVGPRVGYTLHGAQMLDRGWHSGSVFGTHSAAMASGKLRGLTPARLEDALGLAGTQSAGLMAAQFEAMSKRMHHGCRTSQTPAASSQTPPAAPVSVTTWVWSERAKCASPPAPVTSRAGWVAPMRRSSWPPPPPLPPPRSPATSVTQGA